MRVGSWLRAERSDRRLTSFLARSLGVTPRTLRNWRDAVASGGQARRLGRPPYTADERREALALVGDELERQGYPGWRAIAQALPAVPVRLLQEGVATIKAERRKRLREVRMAHRVSTEVTAREAIWTMDGALPQGQEGPEKQVVKDRGSLSYRAVRRGPPAKSADVVALLTAVAKKCGYPLVLASDNGSNYCANESEAFYAENKIVHLRSLPRTPQHNGAAEIGIREALEASTLTARSLASTCERINLHRLRATKGFKTSSRLDEEMVVAYNVVSRDEFYERCMKRVCRVRQSVLPWRMKRRAEREVIFRTLEEYGLVKRTQGGRPYRCEDVEIFL